MHSLSRATTAPQLELLEARDLLAGDVTAALLGGDLFIHGDRADNSIVIQLNEDGDLEVRGTNDTSVNSGTAVVFEGVSSVPDDLRIFMNAGDDQVLLDRILVQDDLFVQMGKGDDSVLVERSQTGDDATILTGRGDDRVAVVNSSIEDRFTLFTGRGDDAVFLDPITVNGKTLVHLGSGDDVLRAQGANLEDQVDFGRKVLFLGSGGEDLIEVDAAKGFAKPPRILGFEITRTVDVVEFSSAEGVVIGTPVSQGSMDFGINEDGTITDPGDGVVNFRGGEVQFRGFAPAYASPPASYATDDGQIEFAVPVQTVSFFFVGITGNATATAFDEFGNAIETIQAGTPTFLGDPGNFVSFTSNQGIAKIVVAGGMTMIDNVAFVRPTEVRFSPAEGLRIRNLNAPIGSMDFSLRGVNFTGGEVATLGIPPIYASPPASYLLSEGTISFDEPVTSVRFFFVHLGDTPSTATAYDSKGNVVATVSSNPTTFLGDPGNFVRLSGADVARVEFSGASAAIDNLSFFQ